MPPAVHIAVVIPNLKVAPGSAYPDALGHRFKEKPVIRRDSAGVDRFAGKKRFDPLLHFITQSNSCLPEKFFTIEKHLEILKIIGKKLF